MPSLKPYPAYADTDLPWLPKIPKHWEVKRLKFVAPANTTKLTDKPDDLPYVGLENIESGTGRLLMETQPETVESNVGIFEKGDILFGKLRPYLAKVVQTDFRGSCTTEILALKPQEIDGRFLFYSLLSPRFIEAVNAMTYGTKMPRASWEQIGNLYLSLPSLPEQRTIAAYLDRQTAKIDALIAKKQRLLDLLAEQRTALISQAVTKGLNPTVKMKDSGVAWLGQVPSHWEVKRNKYLFREQTARSETGRETLLMVHQKLGIVPRQDYMDDRPVIADSLIGYKVCHEDDLVLNKLKGHLGVFYRATAHGIVSPDYTVFKKISNIHTKYYEYLFRYTSYVSEFKRISKGVGSGFLRLYTGEFNEVPALIPPYQEQAQIVEYIDNESVRLADLGKKIETAIERLQEYRAALISSVVTGKVQVK
jgi:type I restriction enzyme S subunit